MFCNPTKNDFGFTWKYLQRSFWRQYSVVTLLLEFSNYGSFNWLNKVFVYECYNFFSFVWLTVQTPQLPLGLACTHVLLPHRFSFSSKTVIHCLDFFPSSSLSSKMVIYWHEFFSPASSSIFMSRKKIIWNKFKEQIIKKCHGIWHNQLCSEMLAVLSD